MNLNHTWHWIQRYGRQLPTDMITGAINTWHGLDWEHLRHEVNNESCGRILVIGHPYAGKSSLVNWLKDFPVSPIQTQPDPEPPMQPAAHTGWRVEDYGLFCIMDVPSHVPAYSKAITRPIGPMAFSDECESQNMPMFWEWVQNSDLILWIINAQTGLQRYEHEWINQLRNSGKPLLWVLNKSDTLNDEQALATLVARLNHQFGGNTLNICAQDGSRILSHLLPHIIMTKGELATSLGRDIPKWRKISARRIVRRAALLSGILGLEPTPLIDMPLQIMLQLRMMLRIMSTFGVPIGDRYGREMLITMAVGMILRLMGLQLVKALPVIGWLLAGGLATLGTLTLGNTFIHYFSQQHDPLNKHES